MPIQTSQDGKSESDVNIFPLCHGANLMVPVMKKVLRGVSQKNPLARTLIRMTKRSAH